MKSYKQIPVLLFLFIYTGITVGQEISYGSNNGKYIKVCNTNLYYEEYGSGLPLVLLHGGFGSIYDFQKVIPEFAKHFKVIAVDSPGHGRSEQTPSLSFEIMADCISSMIDQLNLDRLYIVGYSDGGITALLLAEKRPDKVKKIVASGINSRLDGLKPEILDYLQLINPSFIETNQKEWLTAYQSKSPEKNKWQKYITDLTTMYAKEVFISAQTLSNIQAEVLLVYGDKDVIKLAHGIELYHNIAGSQFCVLPNTPHELFTARPELISTIGIEFLTK